MFVWKLCVWVGRLRRRPFETYIHISYASPMNHIKANKTLSSSIVLMRWGVTTHIRFETPFLLNARIVLIKSFSNSEHVQLNWESAKLKGPKRIYLGNYDKRDSGFDSKGEWIRFSWVAIWAIFIISEEVKKMFKNWTFCGESSKFQFLSGKFYTVLRFLHWKKSIWCDFQWHL